MVTRQGQLRFAGFGYSMPAAEPLFQRPPFKHHALDRLNITFETEYESAAKILPDLLRFSENPPLATLMIAHFKNAAVANYLEAILMLHCQFDGREMLYMPSPLVTVTGPMITGRELWGYPKRPAAITFERSEEKICAAVSRPNGKEILRATVKMRERLPASAWQNRDGCFVKIIPSIEEGRAPDACYLAGCRGELTPVEENGAAALWDCEGTIVWGAESNDDAWRMIPINRIVKSTFGVFDSLLGYGYVMHDYLKKD